MGEIGFDLAELSLVQHPAFTLVLQTPRAPKDRNALTDLISP
jgi:hypothetical protein